MDLMDSIEGVATFKRTLTTLADLALTIQADAPLSFLDVFGPEDLVNATLVFNAVLFPLTFQNHEGSPRMEGIAEELGNTIKETVQQATGIDLHEAVKSEVL